jgi:hypothetical protein
LRFDPPLELLVKSLDGVGVPGAAPLARRQSDEGEEPVAGFFQAVGDRAVLEPPIAEKGRAARCDLAGR